MHDQLTFLLLLKLHLAGGYTLLVEQETATDVTVPDTMSSFTVHTGASGWAR